MNARIKSSQRQPLPYRDHLTPYEPTRSETAPNKAFQAIDEQARRQGWAKPIRGQK